MYEFRLMDIATACGMPDIGILAKREFAKKMFDKTIKDYGEHFKDGEIIALDCSDIIESTSSVIDEYFYLGLLEHYKKWNIVFVLKNVSETFLDNIKSAIIALRELPDKKDREYNVNSVYIKNDEYCLITEDKTRLNETFELVKKRPITTSDLSAIENITINCANNRLNRLFERNLIFRKQDLNASGKPYIYYLE